MVVGWTFGYTQSERDIKSFIRIEIENKIKTKKEIDS